MNVQEVLDGARSEIETVADIDGLDELERKYLGKKGELPALKKTLGQLDPEQRREAGQELNSAIRDVTDLAAARCRSGLWNRS